MRLNTVLKVIGLSAALAMPLALVGCDDEDTVDPGSDAGPGSDASGSDATVIPGSDASESDATTTPVGDGGSDASTSGDAGGDAATNG